MVDKVHKVPGRAVARRCGKIAGALIAPGIVKRILGDGHELDAVVAKVQNVIRQLACERAVVVKIAVFAPPPRTEVDLVNVERRAVKGRLCAARPPFVIPPAVAAEVIELAGRTGAGLGVESIGVGLERGLARLCRHSKLVGVVALEGRHKTLPETVRVLFHRVGVAVPAAEIAHNGHMRGVRRPGAEDVAVFPRPPRAVRAEIAVGLAVRAAVKGCGVKSSAGLFHASCPFSS